MKIIINRETIDLPESRADITLGDRISFHHEHGQLLSQMHKSIMAMEDEEEKGLELAEFLYETMVRTFSFFTGIKVDVLKTCEFTEEIASVYYNHLAPLFDDTVDQLQTSFDWNEEKWCLPDPVVKQNSKYDFGEFIDIKQCIQDMIDEGKSPIERLLPICAVFLRKSGEPYREEFLYENSDRLELMKSLPMDMAAHVAFFLNSSMDISKITSQSSGQERQSLTDPIVQSTSSAGDGPTFLNPLLKQKSLTSRETSSIPSRAQEYHGCLMC